VTAVAVPAVAPERPPLGFRQNLAQVAVLTRRGVVSAIRQPHVWGVGLLFPIFLAAVNTSTMSRATQLPGFPHVDSFLQFLLPASITHAVLFGGLTAGTDTAIDLLDGFFDRLVVSPVSRTAVIFGRLSGAAVTGGLQALILIGLYRPFDAPVRAGLTGVVLLVVYAMLMSVIVGGFSATIAFRTSSAEAIGNVFPLAVVALFGSSAFFPTSLMHGGYGAFARHNPVTWMLDGMRVQVTEGLDWSRAGTSLGTAVVLSGVFLITANLALRGRIKRAR
jgi:ABC-2 type transport system permease protein